METMIECKGLNVLIWLKQNHDDGTTYMVGFADGIAHNNIEVDNAFVLIDCGHINYSESSEKEDTDAFKTPVVKDIKKVDNEPNTYILSFDRDLTAEVTIFYI